MNDFLDSLKTIYPFYDFFISIVDIVIVAALIYGLFLIVGSNTKTLRIFKGAILVVVVDIIANFFQLQTLEVITQNLITWGILVFIIIFQPELRSFLERMGRSTMTRYSLISSRLEKDIDQLTIAVLELSREKTGALITIERGVSLNDFVESGVKIDADITSELILTIFQTNTPLHDGAIIIQGDRIACASTYFPPPTMEVMQSFGSRHRAALGISEITDALTIVVSEETGKIRLTEYGEAFLIEPEHFKDKLIKHLTSSTDEDESEVRNRAR